MNSERENKITEVTDLFKVLGHLVRIQVLVLLTEHKELSVSAIQAKLDIEQSALSHHLIKMKDKRILRSCRRGRELRYSIANPKLAALLNTIYQAFEIPDFEFLGTRPQEVADHNFPQRTIGPQTAISG